MKSVTLKAEQPTLVVNRSCTLCVQEPTVSCAEVVVRGGADSWRAEQLLLYLIHLQVGKPIQNSDHEAGSFTKGWGYAHPAIICWEWNWTPLSGGLRTHELYVTCVTSKK